MLNLSSSLHGGAISTIIDTTTTVNILMNDRDKRRSTSAELNMSFQKGIKQGETMNILTQCDRVGRNLGFSQAWLYNENGDLLSTGRHIKAMLNGQPWNIE